MNVEASGPQRASLPYGHPGTPLRSWCHLVAKLSCLRCGFPSLGLASRCPPPRPAQTRLTDAPRHFSFPSRQCTPKTASATSFPSFKSLGKLPVFQRKPLPLLGESGACPSDFTLTAFLDSAASSPSASCMNYIHPIFKSLPLITSTYPL